MSLSAMPAIVTLARTQPEALAGTATVTPRPGSPGPASSKLDLQLPLCLHCDPDGSPGQAGPAPARAWLYCRRRGLVILRDYNAALLLWFLLKIRSVGILDTTICSGVIGSAVLSGLGRS